jgi:hypothetical protein
MESRSGLNSGLTVAARRAMKLFTFVIVLIAGTSFAQNSSSFAKPLSPLDQALITNTKAVLDAEKNKDADFLRHTLSDDFVEVGSEGHVHPKAEFLDGAREGELKDYSLYNLRVRAIDQNSAIVNYNAIIQMPEGDGGAAPRYQIISDLWVRDGESWKLRFQQATPLRSID